MPRRYIISFIVFACALAAIALVLLQSKSQLQAHTLPDGSKIILRRVSYGHSHQFAVGNFWQHLAARVIPSMFAKQYPTLQYSDTNTPSLMLWFEHTGARSSTNYTYGGNPKHTDPPDWQGLFDDSGTDLGIYYPEVSAHSPGYFVQGFRFGALPSSSRQLHFRHVIADRGGTWNNITVFTFDNPAYRGTPTNHTRYPLTLQQSNVTMVINYFRPKKRKKNHSYEMEMEFAMFKNGKPDPLSELHDIAVYDLNGGKYQPGSWGWGHPDNRTGMEFDGGLSTNSLWKLRFGIRNGDFLTNEIITLTNLSIPSPTDTAVEFARIPFQGTTLVLCREETRANSTVDIKAVLDPEDENYFMRLLEVTKTNGQPFDWSHHTYINSQSDTHRGIGLPAGVTNVDLKFGITKKLVIETTAQPTAH